MVRGVVFTEIGQERLEVVDDLEVAGPGPGEVRVAIRATGVCHSDLSAWTGVFPHPTPCVLGHEGAGEVLAVGDGVSTVSEGDRVIVSWIPPCGTCRACRRGQPHLCQTHFVASMSDPKFSRAGAPYYGMAGTGTFAEELTLPESAVVPMGDDVPFEVAALIGCGVMTGVGAVINTARVEPGSSVAVIGCGGVGIAAVQGARVAGAGIVVAIDTVASKLDDARRFGATHAVTPEDVDAVKNEFTAGEGFDHVFEAVGGSATIRRAYDLTRRGGSVTIIGMGRVDDHAQFSAFELAFNDKSILGSVYGGANVATDFERLLRLWRSGQLDLEGMISRRLPLEQANEAFDAMRAGEVIRQVLTF